MRPLILLSVVALAACAGSRSEPGTVTQQTIRVVDSGGGATQLTTSVIHRTSTVTVAAPTDQVWRTLPAVYETLGIPVGEVNTAARTIGNPGFQARRQLGRVPLTRYFDCGRTQDRPSAETYELQISVATLLQPTEANTTTVRTAVQATARPLNFASGTVQCSSTGALETRIAELVRAEAQR